MITVKQYEAWRRHQMVTLSALLAISAGNSPVTGEFPTQRPVTRSFDVFFDLRLSKQWWGWWFETPSCPLWRHSNKKILDGLHKLIFIKQGNHDGCLVSTIHARFIHSVSICMHYSIKISAACSPGRVSTQQGLLSPLILPSPFPWLWFR